MEAEALAPELLAWVAEAGGGRVARAERHVARREAWALDVARSDGSLGEYFLRVDRAAQKGRANPFSLARETRVLEALGRAGLRVPRIHGWSEVHQAALQERVRGSSELPPAPPGQRAAVLRDFMDELARLHALAPEELQLADFALPKSARDAALGEVDKLEAMLAARTHAAKPEPCASFGAAWLRGHAPERLERVALVQGDTGPGNFLYEGDRVTAIVDWEWAHYGDPMEDLGNLCVREFFSPCGGLAEAFARYAERTGAAIPLARVRYYRVQQMVRSVIGLVHVTEPHDPRGPVAMNLAYRVICQRALCEAIADAMGVALAAPELPEVARSAESGGLHEIVASQLASEIAPKLETAYLRHRAESAAALVTCLERERRIGPALEAIECDELASLLGALSASPAIGLAALDAAIRAGNAPPEEQLVSYLYRRAARAEALYAPVVAPFAGRRFSAIG